VIEQAANEGVATVKVPKNTDERREWLKKQVWKPIYPEYKYDKEGLR
jgi:hypothetical protein